MHKPRVLFDEVAWMSVGGVGKPAIARIKRIAWNTAARWLALAAAFARGFNHRMLQRVDLRELQTDEIRSFLRHKGMAFWIHTVIEVWSRLWLSKDFRKNRVCPVETRLVRGSQARLDEALFDSEDSSTLNTSFVESLNLTIRHGSSYLSRRSAGHARYAEHLEDHVGLLQYHYNFIRPRSSLKLGKERRTPAWQAELLSRQLTLREVFLYRLAILLLLLVYVHVAVRGLSRTIGNRLAARVF